MGGLSYGYDALGLALDLLDWNKIEPGRVFTYSGPRRLLRRRGLALGKVIGVESSRGAVHVRTYFSADDQEGVPSVDIGHLPILASKLLESIVKLHDIAPVESDCWETVNAWRRRSASGEVGAFATPLWEAERLARSALPPDARDRAIAYAFVKRSGDGKLSTVEVATIND